MAKKQKKNKPERAPTKHQLSKWQRQLRIRRIVIIAAAVFLVGIGSWVGYESYQDYKSDPLREVVIEVNGVPFTMGYFVKMLNIHFNNYIYKTINDYFNIYVQAYPNATSEEIVNLLASNAISALSNNTNNITNMLTDEAANNIINDELLRQGAKDLGIEVTTKEVDARLTETELPNDRIHRDAVSANLSQEKLIEYFDSQLPKTMEQAHAQVMLVESQEVASELIAEIEAGGNFTALVDEFSCNSSIEGDLGWLPRELMPNTMIANTAFNLTPGEISQPIYDETAIKNIGTTGGYWLVMVIDRGDYELEETVKKWLIYKHLNEWFEEWKKNSTIENLLDEEKKSWAVDRALPEG